MTTAPLPLTGVRVLIPRGGELGDRLATAIAGDGGEPVIAPIIEFREPGSDSLAQQCERLSAGDFDWVAVTSANTVEALARHGVTIPPGTRVAVVGPATGSAMEAAGYPVDFIPQETFSAAGMLAEWPGPSPTGSPGTVLLPQSAIAEPTLADGLAARGFTVAAVTAYETVVVPWSEGIRAQAVAGDFDAVLLTSASMARAVAAKATLPTSTVVACIGESTAVGARAAGLRVHAVAEQSTAEGLVAALITQFSSTQFAPTRLSSVTSHHSSKKAES
jgi:uroporphyrinogen-III synthase